MPGYRVERWNAYHTPNAAMLRYTLSCEGFEVFQWSDRPGAVYGAHKHGEDQSHWIVSGQLEIHVQYVGAFLLGPGDRDFIPAETYHSARVIGDEPVLYLIGIKQPPPPSPEKPRRKPTTKRKPAVKKEKPVKGTKTEKPKRKLVTKRKPAEKKAITAKITKKNSKLKK